jgi:hypothetical protein
MDLAQQWPQLIQYRAGDILARLGLPRFLRRELAARDQDVEMRYAEPRRQRAPKRRPRQADLASLDLRDIRR